MMARYGRRSRSRKAVSGWTRQLSRRLGCRIRFWPQLWHPPGGAIARHPDLRRRQAGGYFRSEFIAALKIIQHGDIDPAQFNGSWRGPSATPNSCHRHFSGLPSTSMATAAATSSIPSPMRSVRPPPICARAAGFRCMEWGTRSACPSINAGPSGRNPQRSDGILGGAGFTRIDGQPLPSGGSAGLLLPAGPAVRLSSSPAISMRSIL